MNLVWTKYPIRAVALFFGLSMLACTSNAPENIWDAVVSEDLKAIEKFLDQGVDLNEGRDSDDRLPLMHATLHRQPQVIEFLIENGADVNTTDSVESTCLVIAAFLGDEDSTRVLLSGGADLFRRNIIGEDALAALEINWEMTDYYANEVYQLGVTQEDIETGRAKVRPILVHAWEQAAKEDVWVALALGRLDLVKSHLSSVDDLATIVTPEGSPILVAATALGHLKIVEYLLQAGADIESRDAFGSTSLFVAAIFGHEDIAEVLIEKDADVFTVNYLGTDLNNALELNWDFTNGIALQIGLSLERAKLRETRTKIKDLVLTAQNAQDISDSQKQE